MGNASRLPCRALMVPKGEGLVRDPLTHGRFAVQRPAFGTATGHQQQNVKSEEHQGERFSCGTCGTCGTPKAKPRSDTNLKTSLKTSLTSCSR